MTTNEPKQRGFSYTMPKITWEWAGQIMAKRWPNTRRVRNIEAYFLHSRVTRKDDDGVPLVVEANPEATAPRQSKKTERKNGR